VSDVYISYKISPTQIPLKSDLNYFYCFFFIKFIKNYAFLNLKIVFIISTHPPFRGAHKFSKQSFTGILWPSPALFLALNRANNTDWMWTLVWRGNGVAWFLWAALVLPPLLGLNGTWVSSELHAYRPEVFPPTLSPKHRHPWEPCPSLYRPLCTIYMALS